MCGHLSADKVKISYIALFIPIVWPYELKLWIALLVSVSAFSVIYFSFSKLDKRGFKRGFDFGKAMLEASQILVYQGMIHH